MTRLRSLHQPQLFLPILQRSKAGLQTGCGSRSWERRFLCEASGFASLADGSHLRAALEAHRTKQAEKQPLESRVLQGVLDASEVPYSSYVPEPRTVLHAVDPRIKQLWIVALLVLAAKASAVGSSVIAAGVVVLTVTTQPPRLWRAQLPRLLALTAFLAVLTAVGSDGVPPLTTPRASAVTMDGLPSFTAEGGYRYVIFDVFFFTVTRRSVKLAAQTSSLTFAALQSAALMLTSTPAEAVAMAMRTLLSPLRLLRVPTAEIGLTLLLSLRFMAVCFEEVRNLALGVAARGIEWRRLGKGGSLKVVVSLFSRLFSRLLSQSETIGEAMVARGFRGPREHKLYLTQQELSSPVANALAVILLAACVASFGYL